MTIKLENILVPLSANYRCRYRADVQHNPGSDFSVEILNKNSDLLLLNVRKIGEVRLDGQIDTINRQKFVKIVFQADKHLCYFCF